MPPLSTMTISHDECRVRANPVLAARPFCAIDDTDLLRLAP